MSDDIVRSETEIDALPSEVLEVVFDFLCCNDRKSASLVCKQWSAIAFSNRYLNKAFVRVPCGRHNRETQEMLLASKREYRNIFVFSDFGRYAPDDWQMLKRIMFKFGQKGRRFNSMVRCTPSQARSILGYFPNLRELIVALDAEFPDDCKCSVIGSRDSFFGISDTDKLERQALGVAENVTVSSLPNVTKLSLRMETDSTMTYDFTVLHRISPKLKEMYIYTKESYLPMARLRTCRVRLMMVSGTFENGDQDIQKEFYGGVMSMKKAYPDFEITVPLLQVITSTCQRLTALRISTNWLSKKTLRHLVKLDQLTELYLFGYFREEMLDGCVPLPTVKMLILCMQQIDNISRFFEITSSIAPGLVDLRILLPYPYILDNSMAEMICSNFRQVKCLSLFGSMEAGEAESDSDTLVRFDQMPNLEHLILRDMLLKASRFTTCNLKVLRVTYCRTLTDDDVVLLAMLYPKLQLLEIGYCENVSKPGVQAIWKTQPPNSANSILRLVVQDYE